MSNAEYDRNRIIAFEEKGINPNNKEYNCHHKIFLRDIDEGLVRKDYPINAVENLMPLKIYSHAALNTYLNTNPELYLDITNRQDLADRAEAGEFDYLAPIKIRTVEHPKKKKKGKKRGHTKHKNKHRR